MLRIGAVAFASSSSSAPSDAGSPIRDVVLPCISLASNATVILQNVTIKAAVPMALYTSLCSSWSFRKQAALTADGALELRGLHEAKGGLWFQDITIVPLTSQQGMSTDVGIDPYDALGSGADPARRDDPDTSNLAVTTLSYSSSMSTPCAAYAVQDELELNSVLSSQLAANRHLYLSIVRNVTINPDTWATVRVPRGASFSLLGDPETSTELDLGGVFAFNVMERGALSSNAAGVCKLSDLALLNMIPWDVPASLAQALVAFAPPFFVRRWAPCTLRPAPACGTCLGPRFPRA